MVVKVVDLFCGAGGLTHGLQLAGLEVVAGIDLESACRIAYESNNDALFIEKDISLVTKEEIDGLFDGANIKVLAGCAPCQPFSKYTQGLNKSEDKKWPLLYEFARLIAECQPDLITMENVPDVTKHKVYEDFVNNLRENGYSVWADRVDCTKYGVPQNRLRHVLLASKFGPIQFAPEFNTVAKTVQEAIEHLPAINHGEIDKKDPLHRASKLSELNFKRIISSKPGGTWRDWPKDLLAACHQKESGKGYGGVYGRMEWNKPSPTITTLCYGFGNGRFGHPTQARAISLREAALLQTFPLHYQFAKKGDPIKMKTIGKMIGNAVPVNLGKAIGISLVEHIKIHDAASLT
ncbi:DNA cytosine methyltransferase [Buttiauxella sp. B2]|uniref:DNA cytosine methyltransferase n=1 Tax=Buttiauxella sp. B2 TaxID=2587812 RepID=UPI00112286AE|nr:DNA cytosine methyltransferase [Buttiauxella sp. B2]TNV11606.1 DNA cytosine methyltransferase [Buttiauxella sp. B2]